MQASAKTLAHRGFESGEFGIGGCEARAAKPSPREVVGERGCREAADTGVGMCRIASAFPALAGEPVPADALGVEQAICHAA